MKRLLGMLLVVGLVECGPSVTLAAEIEPNAQRDAVADLKGARRKALRRQRRVIFNDDTYELSRDDADTPEGFLKRRLQPLVGR